MIHHSHGRVFMGCVLRDLVLTPPLSRSPFPGCTWILGRAAMNAIAERISPLGDGQADAYLAAQGRPVLQVEVVAAPKAARVEPVGAAAAGKQSHGLVGDRHDLGAE